MLSDEREVPVECRYVGVDADGCHSWVAVYQVEMPGPGPLTLRIGVLPGKTSVGLEVVYPEGHSER